MGPINVDAHRLESVWPKVFALRAGISGWTFNCSSEGTKIISKKGDWLGKMLISPDEILK